MATRDRRDGAPDQAEGEHLAAEYLGRTDRRDPEELDHAARPLAHERQRDEGDREVLQDQRHDGGAEVRDDTRFRGCLVGDLGAGRGGDDLRRDGGRVRLTGAHGIALTLRSGAFDDGAVDRTRETRCEEPRIVHRDRIDGVHLDLDDALLAGAECAIRVVGRDDEDVGGARRQAAPRRPRGRR